MKKLTIIFVALFMLNACSSYLPNEETKTGNDLLANNSGCEYISETDSSNLDTTTKDEAKSHDDSSVDNSCSENTLKDSSNFGVTTNVISVINPTSNKEMNYKTPELFGMSSLSEMKYNLYCMPLQFYYSNEEGYLYYYDPIIISNETDTWEDGIKNYSNMLYNVTGCDYSSIIKDYKNDVDLIKNKTDWTNQHETITNISQDAKQVITIETQEEAETKAVHFYSNNILINSWTDCNVYHKIIGSSAIVSNTDRTKYF